MGVWSMSSRETGSVKWFNNRKGFGFVQLPDGREAFVHYRSVRGDGYKSLEENQKVEFTLKEGEKGLQAEDVVVLDD